MSNLGFIPGFGDQDPFSLQLFLGIGLLGLVLVLFQAVFGMLAGHDGDTSASGHLDIHGGHGGGGSIVSLKTVSAMLLGFGFGGALMEKNGFSIGFSALGGIATGFVIGAVYFVMMHSLYKLKSDGTAILTDAINRSGTVYMRIPEMMSGTGEIQIAFGGRLQNVRAFTRGTGLATGTEVKVVALHGDQALLVEKIS